MNAFFATSYALLCGVVLLKSLILRQALREAVRLKRLCADFTAGVKWEGLTVGALAPEFSAPVLGTGETLLSSCLKGRSTILLFVSPQEASWATYNNLGFAIHALWHRVEGHIYLVCNGGEELCRQVAHDDRMSPFADTRVKLVLDETGYIARAFGITGTPQAVELDDEARIRRYGRPDALSEESIQVRTVAHDFTFEQET